MMIGSEIKLKQQTNWSLSKCYVRNKNVSYYYKQTKSWELSKNLNHGEVNILGYFQMSSVCSLLLNAFIIQINL